jgi:hypothetical protein
MRVNVITCDLNLGLRLADNFLKLLILLLKALNVAIDDRKTALKVVNLVVKDLVVGVHSDFTVDKGIDGFCDLLKIVGVQIFHLLHQGLR